MRKSLVVVALAALALSGCATAPTSEAARPAIEQVKVQQLAPLAKKPAAEPKQDPRVTFISILRANVPKLKRYSDARLFELAYISCDQRASGIRLEDINNIRNDGTTKYPAGELDRYIASGAVILLCPGAGL